MIKKLDQKTISLISAGEVIQRPLSVIKELTENSIDSKATEIKVIVSRDFLNIKIIDNGQGILPQDFPILCHRFTTSKINSIQDLQTVSTFGFRGEALSSVSLVSKVKVTSKTANSEEAFSAQYDNQQMVNFQTTVFEQGTMVEVNDLFYNMPVRQQSVASDEKRQIINVMQFLAIYYNNIRFQVQIDNVTLINTFNLNESCMSQFCSFFNFNPNQIIEIKDKNDQYKCKIYILMTMLNTTQFKNLGIFINGRLVNNDKIKKSVEKTYHELYLTLYDQQSGYQLFINVFVDSKNVDPNVHPCKKEVKILFQNEIAQIIEQLIANNLKQKANIKQIKTQEIRIKNSRQSVPAEAWGKIRVDGQSQGIGVFMKRMSQQPVSQTNNCVVEIAQQHFEPKQKKDEIVDQKLVETIKQNIKEQQEQKIEPESTQCYIDQIHKYFEQKRDQPCKDWINLIVYVGVIGSKNILVQNCSQLLIINVQPILFIFNILQIIKGITCPNKFKDFELPSFVQEQLCVVKNQDIILFPCLHPIYKPTLQSNQDKIIDLLISTQNGSEFIQIVVEFARLFTILFMEEQNIITDNNQRAQLDLFFELEVFPVVKNSNICPKFEIQNHQSILSLQDIYKHFERC